MSCENLSDIIIQKGKTFSLVRGWGALPYTYKAITGITNAAPSVFTVPSHGIPDGWPVAVVSVEGSLGRRINAKNNPPYSSEYHIATVVNANSVSINDLNTASYDAYESGGYLQFYTPVDLSAYVDARLHIRATEDAEDTLLELIYGTDIVLDNTAKTITITIDADVTATLDFTEGVYELELEDSDGVVVQLLKGNVIVEAEIARD